jgi:hypothetical protein
METETPAPLPPVPAAGGPKNNTMAVTSLSLGVASFVLLCLSVVFALVPVIGFASIFCLGLGILLGIGALLTGIIAFSQIKSRGEQGNGMALAGAVMGGLQILMVVCILPVVLIAVLTIMGPLVGQVFSTINASLK